MENQGLSDVIGSTSAPYMNTLATTYGLSTQYTAIEHPSEPNYVALFGGDTFGIAGDGNCCWKVNQPNLVDRLESAGLTWKAFAEDASGSGTCGFNPPRRSDHFPFIDYSDMNTPARCANMLTTASSADSELLTALNSQTPPNFAWLTPNDCNNMHNCSVATGDAYLAGLVPKILTSAMFTAQKAALFVVFDEGNGSSPSDYVYAVWAGSSVRKAYTSSTQYSHYSFLKTIESLWNLPSLTPNDAGASAMTEFFSSSTLQPLSASFTVSTTTPFATQPVTFTSTATGGKTPYAITWDFGDGSTVSGLMVTHVFTGAQTFAVTETVTDSSTPIQTAISTQSITASALTAGSFSACSSLPQGWSCGNTNGLTGSSVDIVNGVLQTRESNPGVGSDNSYYYSTSQKGTFPWDPCRAPANGSLPSTVSSVSTTFTPLTITTSGSYRYHIYVALYYWLPNGPVTAGGSTYRCLDTQVRVENIGGTFSPVGSTSTYDPGDSFGWDNVTLGSVTIGQTYTLKANVADQCQQDLLAWGLPSNTPCQLAGIEVGTEGFQFQELDVNWSDVQVSTLTSSLAISYTFAPANPQTGQAIAFSAIVLGGTGPYTYSWDFGDGNTGRGANITYIYSQPGNYTVTLTVRDSTGRNAATSRIIAVPRDRALIGDVNGDCVVDRRDVAMVELSFGKSAGDLGFDPRVDANHDGAVNILDVAAVAIEFGQKC